MIQDLFITNAKGDNEVFFYGQIEAGDEIENLPNVLTTLIGYASQLSPDAGKYEAKNMQLSQGRFIYGSNGIIIVISKINPKDPIDRMTRLSEDIAIAFTTKFKTQIDQFAGDVNQFTVFSGEVASIVDEFNKKETQARAAKPSLPRITVPIIKKATGAAAPKVTAQPKLTPVSAPSVPSGPPKDITKTVTTPAIKPVATPSAPSPSLDGVEPATPPSSPAIGAVPSGKVSDHLRSAKPITLDLSSLRGETRSTDGPPIKPMKRRSFPSGQLDEYERDEVLWNESQDVMQNFTADFVEGIISRLKLFLSISIQHHYEVELDFTNYPAKPEIVIPPALAGNIGKSLDEIMYFLKNWDPTIPPHILEVARELELVLMNLKSEGKLTPTAELDATMIPDLPPLEELPPLTPEEEKALKKFEEEKKKKQKETERTKQEEKAKEEKTQQKTKEKSEKQEREEILKASKDLFKEDKPNKAGTQSQKEDLFRMFAQMIWEEPDQEKSLGECESYIEKNPAEKEQLQRVMAMMEKNPDFKLEDFEKHNLSKEVAAFAMYLGFLKTSKGVIPDLQMVGAQPKKDKKPKKKYKKDKGKDKKEKGKDKKEKGKDKKEKDKK